MKTLQGLYLSAFFLLMGSGCILTAAELFINTASFQRMSHPMLSTAYNRVANFSSSHHLPNNVLTARRTHSNFYEKNSVLNTVHGTTSGLEFKKDEVGKLARYEELYSQFERLLQDAQNGLANSIHKNNKEVERIASNLNQTSTPFDAKAPLGESNSSLVSLQKHVPKLQKMTNNTETKKESIISMDNEEKLCFQQDTLKTMSTTREDFVNRIINNASSPEKVKRDDLIAILDLYADLILYPKDCLIRVLNGSINTSDSAIYNNVIEYIDSKNSDIDKYRKMYVGLMEAFGLHGMKVIYKTADKMINEKKFTHLLKLIGKTPVSMVAKDYISIIEKGEHPLYPLQPNDVRSILELYFTFKHRQRDVITRVLCKMIDSNNSPVYTEVDNYIRARRSNLNIYRTIYAKIKKSLDGDGMKIIYRMIDEKIWTDLDQTDIALPQQEASLIQSEFNTGMISRNNLADHDCQNNSQLVEQSVARALPSLHVSDCKDNVLQTVDGKYKISQKERERLNRLYGLLPEYHGKSITGVLAGLILDKTLPVWNDVLLAIEQIKREAQQDGETTEIDLNYFRKLHWSSVRVTGKGGSKSKQLVEDIKTKKSIVSDTSKKITKKISKETIRKKSGKKRSR